MRKKQTIKKIIICIIDVLLLVGFIFLEIYMYLRSNQYIDAFEFRDIFFKGGVLDNFRLYDMRMTAFYLVMRFVRATGLADWRTDNEK